MVVSKFIDSTVKLEGGIISSIFWGEMCGLC